MTASFNLLPARYAERMVERRWTGMVAGGLLVLLLLLGLMALGQSRRLGRAESERHTERLRTQELTARRTELLPFRQLAEGIVQREGVLAASMQNQISWAGVLTRLSAALPPATALTSFSAESTVLGSSGGPARAPADDTSLIGTVTFDGYSVEAFDPGVAGILQSLDTVTGLSEPQLATADRGEVGDAPVTNFDGAALVNGAALSGRYAEGLPPGERVDVPRAAPAAAAGSAAAGSRGGQ